ncbi:MAG: hypothetical protein QXN87_01380 [Candidatus Bathyarchaeia archaeon]
MPSRKYDNPLRIRSFAVEADIIDELKPIVVMQNKTLNEVVNELLKAELAKLKGQPQPTSNIEYEGLKREHIRLTMRISVEKSFFRFFL